MDSPPHQVLGPVEDHGIVVRGLLAARHLARQAWHSLFLCLSLLSFAFLGVAIFLWVESLFAEYEVRDGRLRFVLLFVPAVIVGLPTCLLYQIDQIRSIGRFVKRLLLRRKDGKKHLHLVPKWVRQANLILGVHMLASFLLVIYVSNGASIEEVDGHDVVTRVAGASPLTPEEAHRVLSFWVSAAASFFIGWFFVSGMTLWYYWKKITGKAETEMEPLSH